MPTETVFDYYYGDESNQFSFYRIPRQLITGEQFKKLSIDAKLLYGLLLDRMGLSARNGWYDEAGRVYIYYTLDEIQADLNCGHDKALKLLSELDTGRGFGLIERIKQGQGKPTKIYVKRFSTCEVPPQPAETQEKSRLPLFRSPDFGKTEVKSSEKPKPRLRETRSADFGKSDASYIKSNHTDFSYYNAEYDSLCRQYNSEDVNEVVELIADVLCSTRPTLRIGGEDLPTSQVQERFERLDREHLEYVFDCLRHNTTEVRNIRAYLLTTLYNAPVTISNYYKAAVQHDFGT